MITKLIEEVSLKQFWWFSRFCCTLQRSRMSGLNPFDLLDVKKPKSSCRYVYSCHQLSRSTCVLLFVAAGGRRMGRVVFGVIGIIVRRSVVLLVFTVAVRGQTPQSGSAVHLTPGVTQRKSQQDEYSICVAM